LEDIAQSPKQENVVVLRERGEILGRKNSKSIVCEDLTDERPAKPHAVLIDERLCWNRMTLTTTNRPHATQAFLRVHI
jgi:hypothetical protein